MNAEMLHKLELVHHLRYAIEKNELFLHYQPQYSLTTGKISGMEALVRWHHPSLGILPPNEFIPIAEETGLIQYIGAWTLKTACLINKKWQDLNLIPIPISVNLSSTELINGDIIDTVKSALKDSQLAPEYLEIEITESSLISNQERCMEILAELHQIGIYISIDDFGTGYSSLNYLKQLPVDSLKIDRSFVQDINTDPNDAAIVKAVIALAHNLELTVIGEGVETIEQQTFLQENNCDEIQGFYYSKPLPKDEMEQFLQLQSKQ